MLQTPPPCPQSVRSSRASATPATHILRVCGARVPLQHPQLAQSKGYPPGRLSDGCERWPAGVGGVGRPELWARPRVGGVGWSRGRCRVGRPESGELDDSEG
jgi:hypothetical protein